MRNLPALAFAALLAAAPGARAEPYAVLGVSAADGLTMVDVASLTTTGRNPSLWAYVILPEKLPQRVYVEASRLEFDCAASRLRMVSGVRYGLDGREVARSSKLEAWSKVAPKTPAASMHRQACKGAFDPDRLRGQGKTVQQYAAEVRPLLARLPQ